MKKIKKNMRMTSGKGGSGEEVSYFWDHSGMRRKSQKRKKYERKRENKGKNQIAPYFSKAQRRFAKLRRGCQGPIFC